MGSAQKGPPMRKPEPVSGHRSGIGGPAPGMNFTLLPFTTCQGDTREASSSVLAFCCGPEQAMDVSTTAATALLSLSSSRRRLRPFKAGTRHGT